METCRCSKEKELDELRNKIHKIQLKDVEKEKDMERFQMTLDKMNSMLDELRSMIEQINNRPMKKYERVENIILGGVLGAIVTFVMSVILGGVR